MESRGKLVIINVDEPLTNLETKLVNHIRAILDALFYVHCEAGVTILSEMLVHTGVILLKLVKMTIKEK